MSTTKPTGGVVGPQPSDRPIDAPLTGDYGENDPVHPLLLVVTTSDNPDHLRTLLSKSSNSTIVRSWPVRIYTEFRSADQDPSGQRQVLALRMLNASYLFRLAARAGHGGNCEVLIDFAQKHELERMEMVTRTNITAALEGGSVGAVRGLHRLYRGVVEWDMGHGTHVLAYAMRSSSDEVFEYLVANGSDVNAGRKWASQRPGDKYYESSQRLLAYAATMGTGGRAKGPKFVRRLIEAGARVKGSGALQDAAKVGNLEVLEILVGVEGTDINETAPEIRLEQYARNNLVNELTTWTPAHWAAGDGREEAVLWFQEKGADMERKDLHGRTAWELLPKGIHISSLPTWAEKNEAWKKLVQNQ